MTREEVSILLGVLKAAYPARMEITPQAVGLWTEMLGDCELEEVTRAAKAHIATSPHPPSIADIRTKVAVSTAGVPDGDVAWGEVMAQVNRRGRGRSWSFSHPAIGETVERLGQDAICDTPVESIGTTRAQFLRAYEHAKGRALNEANVGRLQAYQQAQLAAPVQGLLEDVSKRLKREDDPS